ncbi:hypothetical protein [uncultured Gammaproteobacteria bacterium]|nr:hypothetical protein [uncultured Gammaproteobacteria bacterium]
MFKGFSESRVFSFHFGRLNYYNLSVQFIGGTSPCGGSFVCLHATKLY